jgi:hypothetical protein
MHISQMIVKDYMVNERNFDEECSVYCISKKIVEGLQTLYGSLSTL